MVQKSLKIGEGDAAVFVGVTLLESVYILDLLTSVFFSTVSILTVDSRAKVKSPKDM